MVRNPGTRKSTTAPLAITAPGASDRYDRENENRWRQIVEQAIRDLAASAQVIANNETLVGGSGGDLAPFPRSGITGWMKAIGDDAGNPAFLQWLNPAGSGVDLKLYELYVSFPLHNTADDIYLRVTDTPQILTMPNVANLIHMDEEDSTPILSALYGMAGGEIIDATTGQFVITADIEGAQGQFPFAIRRPMTYPLIVPPGWAVEVSADTDSSLTTIRMNGVASEDPVT